MFKSDNVVAQRLFDAFRQLRGLKRRTHIEGLKSSEIGVLFCIKRTAKTSAGIKVSEISSALKVAVPTVTQLINGLEKKGFAERTMDEKDRRAVRVNLTNRGEQVVKQAFETFYERFIGLVEYLGEEKSVELTDLLTKVFVYFEEVDN